MGAFLFTTENEKIIAARIAYGGMAATPKRALKTEAALVGKTLDQAFAIQLDDYAPIADMRASAEYRTAAANALLHKAILEAAGQTETRVHP